MQSVFARHKAWASSLIWDAFICCDEKCVEGQRQGHPACQLFDNEDCCDVCTSLLTLRGLSRDATTAKLCCVAGCEQRLQT